jgi:hypothetical protein
MLRHGNEMEIDSLQHKDGKEFIEQVEGVRAVSAT